MGKQDARLIIFDMDGVILDSEPLHENARQMMFKKYGIIPDEKMPEAVLKNRESPLEGYEETPVRVILVPVANPADTGKSGNREMAPAEGPKTK